jgi:cyclomaltodextrinase
MDHDSQPRRGTAKPGRRWSVRALIAALATLTASPGRAAEQPVDYSRETARTSRAWLRDGVVYEIFPRNFSATGDFNGITARLDELHKLGVTILWLMPIHPVGKVKSKGPAGSPYAVRDYYAINPDYGTEDDLKRLVREAHRRGMKVIIDIVANHTAWDSVLMQHPEFYRQDAQGNIVPPHPTWTDVAGLNYQNPKLREYMIAMLKHWIDPHTFDLDGFRCDVAYEVPAGFWEQARVELERVKPDIMMLAEASKPELLLRAFDIDYAWPMLHTLDDVLANGAPANSFRKTWEDGQREFPQGALHLRMSDDHDEARAIAKYGLKGALAASVLMFTLDGVPLLYNGMEAGDATESGDPALFEKMPVFWHSRGRPPLREIYRQLIALRLGHPAFRNERVTWLHNSDEADVVSFMRADDREQFVVVINFSNRPVGARVHVWHGRDFKPVTPGAEYTPPGFPRVALNGFEYRVYRRALEGED